MAQLPIFLPNGYIAVYGAGSTVSPSGISNITPQGVMRWGSVYQVWAGGETYVYGGDSVMFKETDVFCRLAYNTIPYTILPARLVTVQEPLL